MCSDQRGHRLLQAVRIHSATVEFDVKVGRHTAEFLLIRAPDPVGVLHGGQRERRIVVLRNDALGYQGLRGVSSPAR